MQKKMFVLSVFLIGFFSSLRTFADSARQVIWTCTIPCETDEAQPQPLPFISVGWCGVEALRPKMIEDFTPLCRKISNVSNAHAVRRSHPTEVAAECETSSNPCEKEGVASVGFACMMICPGDTMISKAVACATNSDEAWSLASQVCPGAKMPAFIAPLYVCESKGQTACTR